ncbi:MAG TPA: glycogen debranching protein, partial [Chloroflexota bacterium]
MSLIEERGLVEEARRHAEDVVLGNTSDLGLLAARTAYQQVWARDSMVSSLGTLHIGDPAAEAAVRRSLATLERFQSPLGRIPHHVGYPGLPDPSLVAIGGRLPGDPGASEPVEDTGHAGCVDSSLWYILGHHALFQHARDLATLRSAWPSLERAHRWLLYQDSNECGLLEVHEAMD